MEDNSVIAGAPSWLSVGGVSDWQRLKAFCEEKKLRLRSLSLYVPPWGWLHAPEGKGAYGFFEQQAAVQSTGKGGCTALGICWPESNGRGERVIKVQLIRAQGILEHWNRHKWQPCMIGDPEWQPGKDDGVRVN